MHLKKPSVTTITICPQSILFFVVVHSVLSGHSKRSQAGPEHVIGTDQHQRKLFAKLPTLNTFILTPCFSPAGRSG